jgi:asparagine synthase (glutamine-hydrolysing)
MCGICGQLQFKGDEPISQDTIRAMARTIVHRGPDDEGYFFDGPVGLGFRRLSIIDLGGGHQPMSDAEESVWVVFNGEIYNYLELRAELEGKGHKFRTNSDTEVLVHGYKQWGLDLMSKLNGMFGFAIWDVKKKRLVVARDAMGIKLIYYRVDKGRLSFGSEIRPVLAAWGEKPDLDPQAVNLFLRFRYTPSPLTVYRGVRKLAPGSMLVAENGECREERWYNYKPVPFASDKEDKEATAELLELYRGAVKRHLLADVPVGILLSGGLDSGLLLALMNEHGGPWPCFTVGYGEDFIDDELDDAKVTTDILGGQYHPIRLDQGEFERSLPMVVQYLEEPVASSSIIPMYFVCKRARQDVKVALIGQGPDELFGGYTRHLGVQYGEFWRGLPGPARMVLGSLAGMLPRNEALKRGNYSLGVEDRLHRYQNVFALAPEDVVSGLFQDRMLPPGADDLVDYWQSLLPQMENLDELNGFQLLEIRSSLPDELLMYADKLSMAHSLEARVPYLDRTVVEFAQRLNASFKVRRGSRKWIHRQVCKEFLPPAILKRKKRGFAVNVVDAWFQSAVGGYLKDILLDDQSMIYRLLKPAPARKLLEAHQSGREDNHKLLFSLVMLEQWMRGLDLQTNLSPVAA